ncbi:16392_t:CDS:1, partial [Funneliformis caledonium]
ETFESEELQVFLNISKELVSGRATGAKNYFGEFLPPIKLNIILSDGLLNLLIDYYNRAYKYNFSRSQLDSSLSNENYVAITGK